MSSHQVPKPRAEDLAGGEYVGGRGLEVSPVNHVELHGVSSERFTVYLPHMSARFSLLSTEDRTVSSCLS